MSEQKDVNGPSDIPKPATRMLVPVILQPSPQEWFDAEVPGIDPSERDYLL